MARMHVDELDIDEALVRRLLAERFPEWAALPLRLVEPAGEYPWFWEIHTWVEGQTVPVEEIDPTQAGARWAWATRPAT